MKKMRNIHLIIVLVTVFIISTLCAQATLITIGQAEYNDQNYNLIWDNDSPFGSIIWLDYTKIGAHWQTQVNWAYGLNNGGVLTYNIDPAYILAWTGDWRLPYTVDGPNVYGYSGKTTVGYNITTSEMGHLFYTELGNKGHYSITGSHPQPGWGLTNKGDFQNLQWNTYWSGTEWAGHIDEAWYFGTSYGYQGTNYKRPNYVALAVRPGNVVITPEPATLYILGFGLIVLVIFWRLRKA